MAKSDATRSASPSLEDVLGLALNRVSSGTTIFLATGLDACGAEFDRLAAATARRFDLVVLLIRDRFETEAPRGAYPFVTAGSRTGSMLDWAFRAKERPLGRDGRIERLRDLGVDVRPVAADADWTTMARSLEGIDDGARS